jgi:hypothetical protein
MIILCLFHDLYGLGECLLDLRTYILKTGHHIRYTEQRNPLGGERN